MAASGHPLTQNELESVQGREAEFRFEYFLLNVRRTRRFWVLHKDGFATLRGPAGDTLLACWPHEDFANAMAEGEWAGFRPLPLRLDAFLETGAAQMRQAGLRVIVFPVSGSTGVSLDAAALAGQLRTETLVDPNTPTGRDA